MLHAIAKGLRSSGKSLVLTDIFFKVIAFVVLTPVIGMLFRGFLSLSGRTILADTDIAAFVLHPLGWLTGILVGGAVIAVLALEQSVLMVVNLSATHGKTISAFDALRFALGKAAGIYRITARMVLKILVLAAPFLAAGGGLFLLLLTEHDINYYLSVKPPVFWIAVLLIGAILAVLGALVIRDIVNWSVAIPLYLFEKIPPGECLLLSRDRVLGHRKRITIWITAWIVLTGLISSLASGAVLWLARLVVPSMTGTLWQFVFALGGVLTLWGLVNFLTSLLAVISFAIILVQVYEQSGRGAGFHWPDGQQTGPAWSMRISFGRVVAVLAIGFVAAALVGVLALRTVRLEDDVEITAHRGGATHAPENTLAAMRQAILDGTDWVEIDVQE